MHRFKVAVGIGILIVIGIPLAIEIASGVMDESSHLPQCLLSSTSNSSFMIPSMPCQDFTDDFKLILIYVGAFCVGLWLLIFGIKEISLRSFSK